MENFKTPEQRESEIDKMIENLAGEKEMSPDEIMSDIATFASYDGNEDPNLDYIEQMAELLGLSVEEMTGYAIKKAEDYFK